MLRDHAAAEASQFKDVVAHTAQHVVRLQRAASGNARAHVKGVEPCHPNQTVGIRLRRGVRLLRIAENQLEIRTDGSEVCGTPEGDVDLQRIFQQEDAKQRGASHHVDVCNGLMTLVKALGPLADYLIVRGGGLQA